MNFQAFRINQQTLEARAQALFQSHIQSGCARTDRLFAALLICKCFAVFLINCCIRNVRDIHSASLRQAEIEAVNASIEDQVAMRTKELMKANAMVQLQCNVARILAEADSWNDAVDELFATVRHSLFSGSERAWFAHWVLNEQEDLLVCQDSRQFPDAALDTFEEATRGAAFASGQGLPGRVWANKLAAHIDVTTDQNLPRLAAAKDCNLCCALAFPVEHGERMIGVLEFFTDRNFELDQSAIEIVQSLGRQIGQFIVRKQSENELKRLASIVYNSNDAIYSKCSENIIRSWNKGAERIFGYRADEVIGKSLSLLVPEKNQSDLIELGRKEQLGERVADFETQRMNKWGELLDVSISWAPMIDDHGLPAGSSVTVRDISERKKADRRVREFYSMVSHELRAPLTSIRGSLGLLENGVVELDSAEGRELVQMARESTERLVRLINHILGLKKIESGNMKLHKTAVDVEQAVASTLAGLRGLAEEHSIGVITEIDQRDSVHADKDHVVQILTNLVSNAIKFSPANSLVKVRAERSDSAFVRFSVSDTGQGISPPDIEKLFCMFQQLDSSDERKVEGSGLGLAICKAFVEEHGGRIGVNSELGSGSTFWFELPVFVQTGCANAACSNDLRLVTRVS